LQGCGTKRKPKITQHTPRSVRGCEGMNPHTPKGFPLWELESWWIPEFSKNDFKGQTSLA